VTKAKKGKRFRYSLDSLLKVRGIREEQEKDKFKESERRLIEEQRKEDEIKAFEKEKYEELKGMMSGGAALPDVQRIMMRKAHLEKVREQLATQGEAVKVAETKKEDQRKQMVLAMIEKKIIDKDKTKTRLAWRKIMNKEEGKFLDDIAVIGYENRSRKKKEEEGTL
jgi:flagellar FliJ protein